MSIEPIGLTRDLPAKRVMQAHVGDLDIVVWRSATGKLSAWTNRCPHRGMRLSFGFVRGNALACLYHGWQFDQSARCRYIPAHPDLDPPATIRPRQYPVIEQDGLIWVSDGEPGSPHRLPSGLAPLRSMTFGCPIDVTLRALQHTSLDGIAASLTKQQAAITLLEISDAGVAVQMAVAMQKTQSTRTNAHFLIDDGMDPIFMMRVSRWCEAARRRGEAIAGELRERVEA